MNNTQDIFTIIKLNSRSQKESDFHEHPAITISFTLGMLITCVITFGLLIWPGVAFWKLQEAWRRLKVH